MTTQYYTDKQTYRLSTAGGIGGGLVGLAIVLSQTTVGPLLTFLIATILAGGLTVGVATVLDESPIGAMLPFLYGVGAATVGLLQFTHDGVFWVLVWGVGLVGFGVVVAAVHRWDTQTSAPLGAALGVLATGLALYVL